MNTRARQSMGALLWGNFVVLLNITAEIDVVFHSWSGHMRGLVRFVWECVRCSCLWWDRRRRIPPNYCSSRRSAREAWRHAVHVGANTCAHVVHRSILWLVISPQFLHMTSNEAKTKHQEGAAQRRKSKRWAGWPVMPSQNVCLF